MKSFPRSILFLVTGIAASAIIIRADSASEIRERKVNVADGVSLRVIEAGQTGSASTLVFIPGWSTGADIWHRQIDAFSKTHRVIAIDPRSQGESTKTTSGNTPEVRAQDLHALLEQVGVRHAILIGWSQGVQDVAAYVERYGTKELMGIVLVDAAIADGADGTVARAQETAEQFKMFAVYQAHQPEFLRGMMKTIISKPQPGDAIERLVGAGMKTPPDIGVAMLVADMFGVDRTPALAKVDCPTLIIASAKSDELARQQEMARQIRGARFEKVEDAAHAVFLDQPDGFGELVAKFIKESELGARSGERRGTGE